MHTRRLLSAADGQLAISIGQMALGLHSAENGLMQKARERYTRFHPAPGRNFPIFVNPAERRASASCEFHYRLPDLASLHLHSDAAHFCGVRHEYALDSLIRVLLSKRLLGYGGFLLHAATVVREGKAFVFTGPSGAGKSTVAALSPLGSVFTDEISLLRLMPDGWQAFGTPFWGEFRAAGANEKAPLAGIYRLLQSREDQAEPISPKRALRILLSNVLFFAADSADTEALLALLTAVVTSIPCYELRFRPHAEFWKVIKG